MSDEAGLRVTMRDCLRAGFCATGTRAWMRAHGYDYRAFVRNGLPVEEMAKWGDAQADMTVAAARERARG